ncbi:biotin/lipoyl-containing protein, partial [Pseudoalteromonas ruthenica]|uniref:biotin/lipoyl-containing protein n=1 Tax=Pseudoalteromonas ruthenica TaxID=151081 RepID=UPI00127415C1
LTVEGDKASMEVPAPQAGKVKEIKINVGDTVKTGSLVFIFETAGGGSAESPSSSDSDKQEAKADKDSGSVEVNEV